MKTVFGHFTAAVLLALVGFAFWTVGHAERRIAETDQELLTLNFRPVESDAAALTSAIALAGRTPVLGSDLTAAAAHAKGLAGYWLARYQELEPKRDAAGSVVETDPRQLLLSADAAFRTAQAQKTDRETLVHAYEGIMTDYADVLRLDGSNIDAAYNYEYVVRLRDAAAKPAPKGAKEAAPPKTPTLHGVPGGPPQDINMGDFKNRRAQEHAGAGATGGGRAGRTDRQAPPRLSVPHGKTAAADRLRLAQLRAAAVPVAARRPRRPADPVDLAGPAAVA